MNLTIPTPHAFDKGRLLSPEEIEAIKAEITPVENITVRVCGRLTENSKYPAGRRGRR